MKLIIDIPEETYNLLKTSGVDWLGAEHILNAVSKGTPLPKGHGDLIDRKEAMEIIANGKGEKAYFGTVDKDWGVIDFLKTVTTIIEADKEYEE